MPRPPLTDDGPVLAHAEHGRPSAYNNGCRCTVCRAANAQRQRRYRERKADPVGPAAHTDREETPT